jgi:hypothetical protein
MSLIETSRWHDRDNRAAATRRQGVFPDRMNVVLEPRLTAGKP